VCVSLCIAFTVCVLCTMPSPAEVLFVFCSLFDKSRQAVTRKKDAEEKRARRQSATAPKP